MKADSENSEYWSDEKAHEQTDRELASKIRLTLFVHHIHTEFVRVRVLQRDAYLEGSVANEKERILAQEYAESIFGIRTVINYLTFPHTHKFS